MLSVFFFLVIWCDPLNFHVTFRNLHDIFVVAKQFSSEVVGQVECVLVQCTASVRLQLRGLSAVLGIPVTDLGLQEVLVLLVACVVDLVYVLAIHVLLKLQIPSEFDGE